METRAYPEHACPGQRPLCIDICLYAPTALTNASNALQPVWCRLAERLLHRTEEVLRPYLQKYLVGVITGELADTELKGSHHDVIFKVHGCHWCCHWCCRWW